MKRIVFVLSMVLVLLIAVGASADFIPIPTTQANWVGLFTSDDSTGKTLGPGPYGKVELWNVAGGVDFRVTLYNEDSLFVRTGAGDFMDFKFNAIDVVVGDIFGQPDVHLALVPQNGDFDGDAGGMFHFGVYYNIDGKAQKNGQAGGLPGPIVFTIINATIDDLVGSAAVAQNGTGQIFVADIYSADATSTTAKTGLVDVSGSPVPEPATMLLLGSGLLGLAGYGRKKFFKK